MEARRFIRGRRVVPALILALIAAASLGAGLASAVAPAVTVENASDVSFTSAHAEGTVDPQGLETSCHFEFVSQAQLDENVGNGFSEWEGAGGASCNVEPLTGTGLQTVEAQLEGLTPSTVYHLRLVASNEDGESEAVAGSTFETEAVGPASATIDPVTDFAGTTAHFSGSVNPQAPAGNPAAYDVDWHFECSPECPGLTGGTIPADSSDHSVEADASGLEPNTAYEVKLVATNAGGPAESANASFTTDAVEPSAETVPAFALEGGTTALLGARIDPQNSATTYRIEYGPTTAYGETVTGDTGSGSERQVFSQEVGGLMPSTTYHFRVVGENSTGETVGRDMSFKTAPSGTAIRQDCPNAQLREENGSNGLADCRAYEMVSPRQKNGLDASYGSSNRVYVAAENGEALAFETAGALPGAEAGTTVNENLSTRGSRGWVTKPITPPGPTPKNIDFPEFQFLTPNLDRAIVRTPEGVEPTPDAIDGRKNYYWRDNASGAFHLLNQPSPAGEEASGFSFAGVSEDFSHIVFEADAPLTDDAPPKADADSNVYERVGDELRLVAILPEGDPAPHGTNGLARSGTRSHFNLVSDDGSRIIFMTAPGSGDEEEIYVREDGNETIQVSAAQRSAPDPGATAPVFWGASSDLSTIVFTSQRALTDDAAPGDVSLYAFDIESRTLKNMTANQNPDDSTSIVSGVVGMSEDASYVYFVSPSQYEQGKGISGEPNLYLWHSGSIRYIATGSVGELQEASLTAKVAPAGRYLVFNSAERLTAYDNTDAVTGAPDAEVYRYDALADELTCVSCSPRGAAPVGPASLPAPPVRARLNKQRTILNDGSVFYTTQDALLPADSNEKADVYGTRRGQVALISTGTGSGDVFFAGASADGRDVFFATRERLIAADIDANLDVYDARIGGGFPALVPDSGGCSGDECQGGASVPPSAIRPGSSLLPGRGADRPNRLRKALRKCRAGKKPKAHRKRCEVRVKRHFHRSASKDQGGTK